MTTENEQLRAQVTSLQRKIYEALEHPEMPESVRAVILKGHTGDLPGVALEVYQLRDAMADATARNNGLSSQLAEAGAEIAALSKALKKALEEGR